MKKRATIWIENNPQTGEIRSWEVWFQVEGFEKKQRISHCATKENAEKSMKSAIKRSSDLYIFD